MMEEELQYRLAGYSKETLLLLLLLFCSSFKDTSGRSNLLAGQRLGLYCFPVLFAKTIGICKLVLLNGPMYLTCG